MIWLVAGCVAEVASSGAPGVAGPTVAGSMLPTGHVITADDLTSGTWPPVGGIDPPLDARHLVGRTVCSRVLEGEPIYERRLALDVDSTGFDACVPKRSRMFSLAVPEETLAGITVGAYVDLVEVSAAPAVLASGVRVVGSNPLQVLVRAGPDNARLGAATQVVPVLRSPVDATGVEQHASEHGATVTKPGDRAVALRRLEPGVIITSDDLVGVHGTHGLSLEEVVGRVPHERIYPGEQVRAERLADPRSAEHPRGLHAFVPRGMRGLSLPLAGLTEVVEVGDYVDVFVPGTSTSEQALFVLDVHDDYAALLVTEDQALRLLAAAGWPLTPLRWSLRNEVDTAFVVFDTLQADRR